MPSPIHPASYHMPHQGFATNYKNSNVPVRATGYPTPMHHGGYIQRYPPYDAQCQSFPFAKIHEGPPRPPNPSSAYPIVRHYNTFNETPKDTPVSKSALDMFPQNKSSQPTQNVMQKEKNSQGLEKNGRDDLLSSPSDGKSDSETNNTTTESCPDDTRSPNSCDKQENFCVEKNESSMKSDSNSHIDIEPHSKKSKTVNSDTNSEQDSQSFSSISNSNNQAKKENSAIHPPYEMRIPNPSYQHSDNMYGMYPDGERRMHSLQHNPNMAMNPHHMNETMHYGYRGPVRNTLTEVDKLSELDFAEKNNTSENVFQVPSISSTTPPKIFPPIPPSPISESWEDTKYYAPQEDMDSEKVPRKKRKRCGECPGCLQKQNCGRCGPCRSVRSHQICKMRKCESLKTKKEKAAEDAMKAGRKSKELLSASGVESLRNTAGDISGKINGGPQNYHSQGETQSPSNPTTMHLGNQGIRSYVDQYQPQGGSNYQPPAMLNSYSASPQYGSYTP
ncbi:Methylcytosine dioxygenase TET1, partial [Stegodyphus mimosarum]